MHGSAYSSPVFFGSGCADPYAVETRIVRTSNRTPTTNDPTQLFVQVSLTDWLREATTPRKPLDRRTPRIP